VSASSIARRASSALRLSPASAICSVKSSPRSAAPAVSRRCIERSASPAAVLARSAASSAARADPSRAAPMSIAASAAACTSSNFAAATARCATAWRIAGRALWNNGTGRSRPSVILWSA